MDDLAGSVAAALASFNAYTNHGQISTALTVGDILLGMLRITLLWNAKADYVLAAWQSCSNAESRSIGLYQGNRVTNRCIVLVSLCFVNYACPNALEYVSSQPSSSLGPCGYNLPNRAHAWICMCL